MKGISRVVAVASVPLIALSGLVLSTLPASAAGTSYGGTGTESGTNGATGAGCVPGTVESAGTVGTAGGTVTATIGSDTITVQVPANTLPAGAQVVITNNSSTEVNPATGYTVVLAFGISVCVNGAKYTGSFSPVPVTVTGSNLISGVQFYVENGTTYQQVTGATVTLGSITYSLTSDPSYEAAVPSGSLASTAIPNATVVVTGKPFLLEGLIAAILFAAGVMLLVRLRLRRSL